MSSSVFFRFKNQKDVQRVTFDGTGISVFELKRDIINMSRLGDGTDFDFNIYNLDTNEGKQLSMTGHHQLRSTNSDQNTTMTHPSSPEEPLFSPDVSPLSSLVLVEPHVMFPVKCLLWQRINIASNPPNPLLQPAPLRAMVPLKT